MNKKIIIGVIILLSLVSVSCGKQSNTNGISSDVETGKESVLAEESRILDIEDTTAYTELTSDEIDSSIDTEGSLSISGYEGVPEYISNDIVGAWWYEDESGEQPAIVFNNTGRVYYISNITYGDDELEIKNNKCYINGAEYEYIDYMVDITHEEDRDNFLVYLTTLVTGEKAKVLYYDNVLLIIKGDESGSDLMYSLQDGKLVLDAYENGVITASSESTIEKNDEYSFKLIDDQGEETEMYRIGEIENILNYLD